MDRSRTRLGLLPLLLVVGGCVGSAGAQSDGFHILVTNDDGIESPGIIDLAAALRSVGSVTVVAPCGQQSGASMSIS